MITTAEQCKVVTDKNPLLPILKATLRVLLTFQKVEKIKCENFDLFLSFFLLFPHAQLKNNRCIQACYTINDCYTILDLLFLV